MFNPSNFLRLLRADSGSLRDKAVRGSFWAVGINSLTYLGSIIRVLVLARLLTPEDIGLMGIALIVLGCLEMFTQTGYVAALVQRPGEVRNHLGTVLGVHLLRGLGLAGLVVASGPVAAWFFGNPDATRVVQACAFVPLLRGFENPALSLLQREMQLKRVFLLSAAETVGGLATGIVLALLWRNVWALVVAQVAGSCIRAAGSYLVVSERPRPALDRAQIRELSQFGKWVTATNVMAFLSTNLDAALVGRLCGTAPLGIYQLTYRMANVPVLAMAQLSSSVIFPVYARLQTDRDRARRLFLLVLDLVLSVGIPMVAAAVVLGPALVRGLLGAKWEQSGTLLGVLSLYALMRMIASAGGALFSGQGRPDLDTRMNLWRLVTLALLVYPLTHRFGLGGAAWSAVASIAATLPFCISRSAVLLGLTPRALALRLAATSAWSLLGFALPLAGLSVVLPLPHPWNLALAAVLASTSLAFALAFRHRSGLASLRT